MLASRQRCHQPRLITFDTSEAGERPPPHAHESIVCCRWNFFRRPTKRCLPHQLLYTLLKLWWSTGLSVCPQTSAPAESNRSATDSASSGSPSTGVLRQALYRLFPAAYGQVPAQLLNHQQQLLLLQLQLSANGLLIDRCCCTQYIACAISLCLCWGVQKSEITRNKLCH